MNSPSKLNFAVSQLYSAEVIANPYPYYDLLRDQPIQYGLEDFPPGTVPGQDTPIPAWVVLKHADVVHVARNHQIFSSRDRMQEASAAPTLMLVNHDQPRHGVLRGIAQKAFTPKRVEADVSPWLASTVGKMLEDEGHGAIDFMANLAPDLPARVMTKLLGTPEADYKRLRRWANAFMVTADFTIEERNQCNVELFQYYTDAVAERYRDRDRGVQLSDDLMSAFIQAEMDGNKLTREEVVLFCITLVVAGAETTGYLLGNIVAAMVERPDLYVQMRDDRTLVRPFIEESLRRDGPIQRLFRECTQDTEVGGTKMRAGDWVAVFFASANRDPAIWDRPNEFVLKRPNIGRQLTFSHGIHHCMGSGIARNEADKMINGILDRYREVRTGSSPIVRQTGGLLNYGLEKCPVEFVRS